MDATELTQPATHSDRGELEGSGIAFARRVKEVQAAIVRLDLAAGRLREGRTTLDEGRYAELVTQAYCYATLLSEWKWQGLGLADPRINDLSEEIDLFCAYLEETF